MSIAPSEESSSAAGLSSLAAACLSVGLVSAWAPECNAAVQTQVDYQSSISSSLTYLRVMFGGTGSDGSPLEPVELTVASLPGMGSGSITSELATSLFGGSFAMIGISEGSGSQRLVVSMDSLTYLELLSFEQTFPGFSEAALIDDLINGGDGPSQFLRTNFAVLLRQNGEESSCFSFNSHEPLGTVTFDVQSIPEPALVGLLPISFVALRRRRR